MGKKRSAKSIEGGEAFIVLDKVEQMKQLAEKMIGKEAAEDKEEEREDLADSRLGTKVALSKDEAGREKDFAFMQEAAGKLSEGALTIGTVSTYKR
jgi:hypothetical protein